MKTILILGLHSALNSGDAALATVAVAIARRAFPGDRVVLSANDPASYAGYADQTIGSLVSSIWNRPRSAIGWRKLWTAISLPFALMTSVLLFRSLRRVLVKGLLREQSDLLTAIARADTILACPGGYIYERTGPGAFLGMMFPFVVARLFGKRVVFLPQSIGPCRSKWQRAVIKWILLDAAAIMVRERNSQQFVAGLLGAEPPTLILFPDMAFAYVGDDRSGARDFLQKLGVPVDSDAHCLGVTVIRHATQTGDASIQKAYESAILAALQKYAAHLGSPLHVVWFPQCRGPGSLEDDREVIREMIAQLPASNRIESHELAGDLPLGLVWSCYGWMDALIATRMHSAIFALCQGVPVVAISYLYKTEGIMAELGLDDFVVPASGVSEADITTRLLKLSTLDLTHPRWRPRLAGFKARLEIVPEFLANL